MKKRVAVIGAGSWGTVLANVLAENGHQVHLWARRKELVTEINEQRSNQKYLPGVTIHSKIEASSSLREVVQDKPMVLFVVPSHSMREVALQVEPYLKNEALVVHATKGFEVDTWKRISEVLAEELPRHAERIVALSGPSHAEEVILRCPTTVVVASEHRFAAERAQNYFMNQYFRVYTNSDLVGVEVGGALKNIIALAAGLADGLEFGDNAKAALMTRGLAEIARLGFAMGAQHSTFVGLAGVGDLVATCTSKHSRNWRAGHMISQGIPLTQVLEKMGMVVEGVRTTQAAYALAARYEVEMPITEQLYAVLFSNKEPAQAVLDLMNRDRTRELGEISLGW